jgi:hypothetical protein
MHLIYFDESGNSGNNLADIEQPVFVLGALIVPESRWLALEQKLELLVDPFRANHGERFEIHAHELARGEGCFKGVGLPERLRLRDALMDCAKSENLRFAYRSIIKKRYLRWLDQTYGGGVFINPHLAAFPLVAQILNGLLRDDGPNTLGILIFDENREVYLDIERTLRLLRADSGLLRLDRIIEKGFFIDSRKSLVLQLADVCTYYAKKAEERKLGLKERSIDDGGIERLEPLVVRGQEAMPDVLRWLSEQSVKKASGEESRRDSGR